MVKAASPIWVLQDTVSFFLKNRLIMKTSFRFIK